MNEQLSLLPDEVFWLYPVDGHGRHLPEIAVRGPWGPAFQWASVAIAAANELPDGASEAEVFEASTYTRHLYYSLTGERDLMHLELRHYGLDELCHP